MCSNGEQLLESYLRDIKRLGSRSNLKSLVYLKEGISYLGLYGLDQEEKGLGHKKR